MDAGDAQFFAQAGHSQFARNGSLGAASGGVAYPSAQSNFNSNSSSSPNPRQRPDSPAASTAASRKKSRRGDAANQKRRCVSTACIACRKRKSKCDGALPSCAACASVYGTECVYDPNSDHRRKGVYREKVDSMKARNSTLQILIEAILNASEDEVPAIVKKIRTCDSLDLVAEQILKQEDDLANDNSDLDDAEYTTTDLPVEGERELARKMGELRLDNGSVRFFGGTSHLIYVGDPSTGLDSEALPEDYVSGADPITSWTSVTSDPALIMHLMNMYFNYHYAYFTTLSKKLFWQAFLSGRAGLGNGTAYCSSLLVNAMLALGCHFTDVAGAYGVPGDNRTKGDHFFAEAKRLIVENDEYEKARLVTVQALALMSVREAGCAREAKGWVYSGMSFRMAQDIGLNLDLSGLEKQRMTDEELDARRVTFWGCFLFDKCWSNYLGRIPQLPKNSFNVAKPDVFPDEDAAMWSPLTDEGFDKSSEQPARTRAIALQMSQLCEISSDLLLFFYHPNHIGRSSGKAIELKKLSELHQRLEEWRKDLPKEFEPKEGQLPNVILMHMFFHLQYIHLFRPFLKYDPSASPLPAHVSPRRICTANAGSISKLMRLYKKNWGLRQICNIAVYMVHSACTIHLLNLPEKTAKRDIIHGVKALEEIAEDWLCARRTLGIISVLARKWNCELPEDAAFVLQRTDEKYGSYSTSEVPSPRSNMAASPSISDGGQPPHDQGEYSNLQQIAHQHMVPHPQPPRMMGNQILANQANNMMNSARLPVSQPDIDPAAMGFSPGALAGWSPPPPAATSPTPMYPGTFAPSASTGSMGNTVAGRPPPQQQQSVNMDSQDWFIHDSARWAHGFESWDTGSNGAAPAGGSPLFAFQDNRRSGSTAGIVQSDSGEQQLSGFETLADSLNTGGWLPGLD